MSEPRKPDINIDFSLIDERVIKRLIYNGDLTILKKNVNIPKDKRWNTRTLNSGLLQGLSRGESMREIADRILPEISGVPDPSDLPKDILRKNRDIAIRNARTMTTSVEAKARLDSYKELQDKGVVMRKEWVATGDERTRDSHLAIDGEQRELSEVFSNDCAYPADPSGPAEEIWACRCTLDTELVGFKAGDGHIEYIKEPNDQYDDIHESEIDAERERRRGS